MKILMNCLSSVSGGAVSYLRNLAPVLNRRFLAAPDGHRMRFLAHDNQRDLLAGIPGEQCYWIGGRRPTGWRRLLWERRNIDRIIAETAAEILFTPYQVAARASGVKQVLMLRNMEPFLFGSYRSGPATSLRNAMLALSSARSLRAADRVIAVSRFARDHLVETLSVSEGRIRTIYHGRTEIHSECHDTDRDRSALSRLGIGSRFLLSAGSLLPHRRAEDVIAAFDRCAPNLPDGMQLVIAGSGTDRRYGDLIRRAIEASPNRERILAVGHVTADTMTAFYRHCDLCVLATEIEACPNIAIEAMTAGCVIVSADKPPLPEMFAGASLTYRSRDIDHMAGQMRRAMTDDILRQEMRTRARQRASFFSWEKCADETYAALTDWP